MGSTTEVDSRATGGSALKLTVAVAALLAVSAATLALWVSVVVAFVTSGEAIATEIGISILMIGAPTAACVYVVARMSARHDLGLAYRIAWICLPVLGLGIWILVCAVSLAASEVI